jgi:hypothetical protein
MLPLIRVPVPEEGQNDRSQEFIAWYSRETRNRPVGHVMIRSDRRATIRATHQPGIRIRPCPTERILD